MDFLGYGFTPLAVLEWLTGALVAGTVVGLAVVAFVVMAGRQ